MTTHTIAEPAPQSPGKPARPKARLALIDDNREFRGLLRRYLQSEGHEVHCAKDGEEGLALVRRVKPNLVIIDVMMPKLDGIGMLKALRQESQVPVIVLTGSHSEVGQVLGLKLGADDFVYKPVCAEALGARVEAVLRRAAASDGRASLTRLGRVLVDPERREVSLDGKPLRLTIKEFDLLKALIDARGKVLSRERLLNAVWGIGEDCEVRTRTVDQHVAGIRQKLGPEGARILTVPRFGYRIKTA